MELKFLKRTILFGVCVSSCAFGYIPETSYIFSQLAKHQGKGQYIITQDLVFKRGYDSTTVQEKWTVEDGLNVALSVSSPAMQYQAVYDSTGRWGVTDHGKEHVAWPADFVEGFFTSRSSGQILRLIQANEILTSEQLAGPVKSLAERREFHYVANPYIRLTRAEGVPCWTFGIPTAESNSKGLPMLWIGQDTFNIKRLRTRGGSDIRAGEYGHFVKGFDFPKTRHYTWNGNDVLAQVLRIEVTTPEKAKSALNGRNLDDRKAPLNVKPGPLADLIQEFYTRFR